MFFNSFYDSYYALSSLTTQEQERDFIGVQERRNHYWYKQAKNMY